MASGLGRGHLAPAVLDFLFLGQRVVDTGEQLDVIAQYAGNLAGGGLAFGAILVHQQRSGGLEALGLSIDSEFKPGHGFVEQAVPRGGAHRGLIMEEFLQLI